MQPNIRANKNADISHGSICLLRIGHVYSSAVFMQIVKFFGGGVIVRWSNILYHSNFLFEGGESGQVGKSREIKIEHSQVTALANLLLIYFLRRRVP